MGFSETHAQKFRCHTNRSVNLPSFRHFQDRLLTTDREMWKTLSSAQRALRDILMSRGKNCLPTVSRQFLTRNYPRPHCLLKRLPNCLSPTREDIFSSFEIAPAVRVIERQKLSGGNFVPRHQDVSSGPLGGPVFGFLTFRGPFAPHDPSPYQNRSYIVRYMATIS